MFASKRHHKDVQCRKMIQECFFCPIPGSYYIDEGRNGGFGNKMVGNQVAEQVWVILFAYFSLNDLLKGSFRYDKVITHFIYQDLLFPIQSMKLYRQQEIGVIFLVVVKIGVFKLSGFGSQVCFSHGAFLTIT